MHNRSEITWAPFNSVINSNQVLKELALEKMRIKKPILSEDKINDIEEYILQAFHSQTEIKIKYYANYQLYNLNGFITHIDQITKTITINNKIKIYFYNIIDFS